MADLNPPRPAPLEVEGAWISTGMASGMHTWLATVLALFAVVIGLFFRAATTPVLALLFLSVAVGLLGEFLHILRAGEVRARRSRSNCFLVISRKDSPAHFYFYVVTYLVLGGFSLIIACLALV